MAGTREGGLKAAATNLLRNGDDFYRRIGRTGGQNGHTGGFAANHKLAQEAGRLGGRRSIRGASLSTLRGETGQISAVTLNMFRDWFQKMLVIWNELYGTNYAYRPEGPAQTHFNQLSAFIRASVKDEDPKVEIAAALLKEWHDKYDPLSAKGRAVTALKSMLVGASSRPNLSWTQVGNYYKRLKPVIDEVLN